MFYFLIKRRVYQLMYNIEIYKN